ncbi:MAG: PIN domain-containing protein [Longimicrobiales bacterium]
MGVLIDSTVLIDYERERLDLEDRVAGRDDEPFLLSVISVSELLHGVHRADDRVRRARRSAFVEAVLDRFPILVLDLPTARAYAELWAELASAGTLIGAHDLWLAAAALAHGLTLVTSNVRHFGRVPGLQVEDWGAAR